MESWLFGLSVVAVAIAVAVVLDRVKAWIARRSRWVGQPLAKVQLVGRMPDGRVDIIEGYPILLTLHVSELYQYLRNTLMDIFVKMPPKTVVSGNPGPSHVSEETAIAVKGSASLSARVPETVRAKKAAFGHDVLKMLKSPFKLIAYAFSENLMVVQFNHVDGTLDQYAFGPCVEPDRSAIRGAAAPVNIVMGALYPFSRRISIPGGLREMIVGRIPFAHKGPVEDIEVLFFDPLPAGEGRIQMVHMPETVKSNLATLVETSAKYAHMDALVHQIERLNNDVRTWRVRGRADIKAIKDLHTELTRMRTMLPAGARAGLQPADVLVPVTLSFNVSLFVSMTVLTVLGLLYFHTQPIIVVVMCFMGAAMGSTLGFILSYLRLRQR